MIHLQPRILTLAIQADHIEMDIPTAVPVKGDHFHKVLQIPFAKLWTHLVVLLKP